MIRTALTALAAAVVLLVPATAVSAGASVTKFTVTFDTQFDAVGRVCQGANVTGLLTGTFHVEGQQVATPSGTFHYRDTVTLTYRIDYSNGAFALGAETQHNNRLFPQNPESITVNTNLHDRATIFDSGGAEIGTAFIHFIVHVTNVDGVNKTFVERVHEVCR